MYTKDKPLMDSKVCGECKLLGREPNLVSNKMI